MGRIGGSWGEFVSESVGVHPSAPHGGFAPSENQNKIFLRRKGKKHSAPSRWSGPSRTRRKEAEQSLPELAPVRQGSRQEE